MTVKELAIFCGKTDRCIRKWIVKAAELNSSIAEKNSLAGHGKIADYTIDEVEAILRAGSMSKDAVSILMENARNNTSSQIKSDDKLTTILETLTTQNQVLINLVQNHDARLSALENSYGALNKVIEERKALLPPPDISPRKHIEQLVSSYASKTNNSYANTRSYLYREFDLRFHHHSAQSARKAGTSTINWIDSIGEMEQLEAVAIEVLQ